MRMIDPVVVYCLQISMYNFTGEVIVMTNASNGVFEHDFSTVYVYREIVDSVRLYTNVRLEFKCVAMLLRRAIDI